VQRLKTRAQFQAVMAGSTVARTAHFALHRTGLDVPAAVDISAAGPGSVKSQALFAVQAPWLGVLIPKRWAKRAVTRNAIKRQIYTVSQDFEAQLPAAAHVVRLRAGFDRRQFKSASSDALKRAVRAELQQLFAGVRDKGGA
jgi:ribonuclease P protein component